MSEERRKILGENAPENPWEEMIMLRREIFRLREINQQLVKKLSGFIRREDGPLPIFDEETESK